MSILVYCSRAVTHAAKPMQENPTANVNKSVSTTVNTGLRRNSFVNVFIFRLRVLKSHFLHNNSYYIIVVVINTFCNIILSFFSEECNLLSTFFLRKILKS